MSDAADSEKKPKAQRKRKVDDEDEDAEDDDVKPKKAAKAKGKAADGAEAPKAKKPIKTKPLTPEEEAIAQHASLERNKAIVEFLRGIWQNYKDEKEWIKAAAAKKAMDGTAAITEPIRTAKDMAGVPGCGKGTMEKVAAFLKENPTAGGTAGGAFGTLAGGSASGAGAGAGAGSSSAAAAGADEEGADWIPGMDKEALVAMIQSGEVTLAQVHKFRKDVTEEDVQ